MATYKNDYSKAEDFALWRLHDIRSKMAKKELAASSINQTAREIIQKYQLKKLKLKFN